MSIFLSLTVIAVFSLLIMGCTVIKISPLQEHYTYSHHDQISSLLLNLQQREIEENLDIISSHYTFHVDVTAPPRQRNLNIAANSEIISTIDAGTIPTRQQFPAQAELFCLGSGCGAFHFTGPMTIIVNNDQNTLIFNQLNLISPEGNELKGSISFNIANELDYRLIENNIILTINDAEFLITGEGSSSLDLSSEASPGFAGFQLRDPERDIILDLISQF